MRLAAASPGAKAASIVLAAVFLSAFAFAPASEAAAPARPARASAVRTSNKLARTLAPASSGLAILARSKLATGGAAWDEVRTVHMHLRIEASGLSGWREATDDVLTGRHYDTFSLGPVSGTEGWDGLAGWRADQSGQARRMEGGDETLGAADEAYRRCLAYWYPGRWPAEIADGSTREEAGRVYQVVEITPRGGRPFAIWLDPTSWLPARIVEQTAFDERISYLSDYREVDGRKLPFAIRSCGGESRPDQTVTVESVEFNVAADETRYRMPAASAADFAFAGGQTATTLPFTLVSDHIYVQVVLDGRGPYELLCDMGGANVIAPQLARRLGLEPTGAIPGRGAGGKSGGVELVRVDSLAIGGVTVRNQLFSVFATDAWAETDGRPVPALIGCEVLKRFVVRIDYERRLLTLYAPSGFRYTGAGTPVPFRFNNRAPQIEGSIDGIPGKFDIDTGSRASLSLLRPFAERNDLARRLAARYETVTGWGAGGPARSRLARARELRLGDVTIARPVVELSQQQRFGAADDPDVAGSVGAGVLRRFNLVLDYGGQRIIFEPNAAIETPDVYDRSGMWISGAGEALRVVDVTTGGPAQAVGLRPGDRILAVDGSPVGPGTLAELRERFRSEKPGTRIQLTVASGGIRREVRLVLRDLI